MKVWWIILLFSCAMLGNANIRKKRYIWYNRYSETFLGKYIIVIM